MLFVSLVFGLSQRRKRKGPSSQQPTQTPSVGDHETAGEVEERGPSTPLRCLRMLVADQSMVHGGSERFRAGALLGYRSPRWRPPVRQRREIRAQCPRHVMCGADQAVGQGLCVWPGHWTGRSAMRAVLSSTKFPNFPNFLSHLHHIEILNITNNTCIGVLNVGK